MLIAHACREHARRPMPPHNVHMSIQPRTRVHESMRMSTQSRLCNSLLLRVRACKRASHIHASACAHVSLRALNAHAIANACAQMHRHHVCVHSTCARASARVRMRVCLWHCACCDFIDVACPHLRVCICMAVARLHARLHARTSGCSDLRKRKIGSEIDCVDMHV